MNLWAVQIVRRHRSKEIIRAKIVDVDTMQVQIMESDMIMNAIVRGGAIINNLMIENNRVVLTGYDKYLSQNNAKMYMCRESNGKYMKESFAIVLRGYKAIYEFIADSPDLDTWAIHLIGTVADLDEAIACTDTKWESYGLYNGIVTNKTWAYEKDSGRYKIVRHIEKNERGKVIVELDGWDNPEMAKIADIRSNIVCEYCDLRFIGGLPSLYVVKFAADEVTLPEGISFVNKTFGGAFRVVFPKSLSKLGNKCLNCDEDILQVDFSAPIQTIPAGFAAESNLQIFNYPENFDLETIDEFAFYDCLDLRSDLICKVKFIEKGAFANTAIKKAIIPLCNSIGNGAFKGCQKLETAKLGDNVVIKDFAFSGCTKLTNVDLRGATHIGKGAFKDCKKLKDVVVKSGTFIDPEAFHKNTVIHYI